MRFAAAVAAAVAAGACGVRAPTPIDVGALLARRGPVEAHRDLEIRVLADPRDVGAKLALAALDERIGRYGEAIDALEAVERLGGPLGTRWNRDDRIRFARLICARGHARVARESLDAAADLSRCRSFGAFVKPAELDRAKSAHGFARLRHVDADVRAAARAELQRTPSASADRGAFGISAWEHGARREAYEQLAAWHDATPAPRDDKLQQAYLVALAWWLPADAPSPPPADLVGDARCLFAAAACPPPAREADDVIAPAEVVDDPRAHAAANYARVHGFVADDDAALFAIAQAFMRDPAIADRLALDFTATSVDSAAAHATLGALFDALADPARARAHWQAAVAMSEDAAFARGLAEAVARAGDAQAALVFATTAAAASGDPARVWIAVARALEVSERHVEALVAASSALELASAADIGDAFDVATAASRALGRDEQADRFARERIKLARPTRAPDPQATEALEAVLALPNAVTLARAWVASRAAAHDVLLRVALYDALPAEDSRRAALAAELAALAGTHDDDALTAALAIR